MRRHGLKKFAAGLLAAAIVMTSVFSAGAVTKVEAQSTTSSVKVCGNWRINRTYQTAKMPKSAKKVFNKAMNGLTGVSYTPIVYIGSQVVAGTNYQYLCLAKTVTRTPSYSLKIVTVYKSLKGKVSLSDIENFKLSDAYKKVSAGSGADGAYTVYTKSRRATMPKTVEKAFTAATSKLVGAGYCPVAYLGKRVLNCGKDYQVLCLMTTVTRNPETHLCIMTVRAKIKSDGTKKYSLKNVFELY